MTDKDGHSTFGSSDKISDICMVSRQMLNDLDSRAVGALEQLAKNALAAFDSYMYLDFFSGQRMLVFI